MHLYFIENNNKSIKWKTLNSPFIPANPIDIVEPFVNVFMKT